MSADAVISYPPRCATASGRGRRGVPTWQCLRYRSDPRARARASVKSRRSSAGCAP